MSKILNSKKIAIHILIWLAFVLVSLLPIYYDRGSIHYKTIALLCSAIIIFYINYFYLVPRFLLKRKTTIYVVSALVLIFISIFLASLIPFDAPRPFENIEGTTSPPLENFPKPARKFLFPMFPLFFNLGFIVIGTSIRIYEEWNKNERKRHVIESQKNSTELHFLKHQINPHFLFNSLNSIYSLTSKKSDDAPEAVITLSELMRYMLYKTDNDFVLLKDELEYIQNYLKLQRLRIPNNENVTINIHGDVYNQKIRPLLLISFIENAFKHGTNFAGKTEVKIIITVLNNELKFNCINLIGNKKKDKKHSGIGVQNTRERLELLYPEKHELNIKEENNRYIINLTLKLN